MIDSLVTYLTTQCPSFTTVTHAWTTEPVDELSSDAPALFVYLGDKEAGENETDNVVRQRISININLIIVATSATVESLWDEVMAALLGYQPDTGYDDCIYLSGGTIDIKSGYVWREDIYQTAIYARSA